MLYRKRFSLKKLSTGISFTSFEFIDCMMNYSSSGLRLVVVYRPPPKQENKLNVMLFLDEFATFLELLAGDFNFHLAVPTDRAATRFMGLIEAFNLIQHVRTSTHKNGHTLHLVITKANDNFIKYIKVFDRVISDHSAVVCWLSIKKPGLERREITYRNLRSIDKDCFSQDIRKSELANYAKFESVSALLDWYESTLSGLLEQHVPIKKRVVTIRPAAPWYNDQIRTEKAKTRKLERIWRKNKLTINREMFVEQCKCVNRLISDSRMKFYANTIKDNSSNPRVLFSTFVKLLHLKATPKLPSHENAIVLAFFENKVQSLRENMLEVNDSPQVLTCHSPTKLLAFSPTDITELACLLRSMARKSCILDPVSAALRKDCYDVLLPVVAACLN